MRCFMPRMLVSGIGLLFEFMVHCAIKGWLYYDITNAMFLYPAPYAVDPTHPKPTIMDRVSRHLRQVRDTESGAASFQGRRWGIFRKARQGGEISHGYVLHWLIGYWLMKMTREERTFEGSSPFKMSNGIVSTILV